MNHDEAARPSQPFAGRTSDRSKEDPNLSALQREIEAVCEAIREVEREFQDRMYCPFGRKWEQRRVQARLDDLCNKRDSLSRAISARESLLRRGDREDDGDVRSSASKGIFRLSNSV